MKYIFVNEDGFGFKDPEINEILERDVQISDEIYNTFFNLQSDGKQFKIKEINGVTFWDIFEEVIPEPVEQGEVEPSPIEKLQAENLELKKEMENMKQNMQETIAELTMMIASP